MEASRLAQTDPSRLARPVFLGRVFDLAGNSGVRWPVDTNRQASTARKSAPIAKVLPFFRLLCQHGLHTADARCCPGLEPAAPFRLIGQS